MANPGPGQVVIATTGEPTLVRITPNAPFRYDETECRVGRDYDIEVPSWHQVIITTDTDDFTGSRILANRSVSVVSGSSCAYPPGQISGACDYAIEQLVSFDRWGTSFYLAPFYVGAEGYFVLVTAGRSATQVVVDDSNVRLDMGMSYRLEVTTNRMIKIKSDQPIQVVQFIKEGATMVTIPPKEQYTTQNSFIRMNDDETSPTLGFSFSHYFNLIVGCAGVDPITINGKTNPNPFYTTYVVGFTQDWYGPDSMCAYTMTGNAKNTYYIAQPDFNYPIYIVVYGRVSDTGTFAYVEGQEFKRLRCIDYNELIYGKYIINFV